MKSWGTDVIPKEKWIDKNKQYTYNGKKVIIHDIILYNSCGNEVTYPVKVTIVISEKPRKIKLKLFSLDGREDVVWGKGYNLVEINNEH